MEAEGVKGMLKSAMVALTGAGLHCVSARRGDEVMMAVGSFMQGQSCMFTVNLRNCFASCLGLTLAIALMAHNFSPAPRRDQPPSLSA